LFGQYFRGGPVDFSSLRLDFSEGTPFQRKVWKATKEIPYGRLETYKSLAYKINHKGYRSVGGALGKNPFLIAVPCHRVIRTNGDLGGFGAGLDLKKYLLRLEGTWV
jgi:methylated-DNA-[protein]-cysteine S-methyltransferase